MKHIETNGVSRWEAESYAVEISQSDGCFRYYRDNALVYCGELSVTLDTAEKKEVTMLLQEPPAAEPREDGTTVVSYRCGSSVFSEKQLVFTFYPAYFTLKATVQGVCARITDITYGASGRKEGFPQYISPRFDWNAGTVCKDISEDDILSCQQWLSPPPFAFVYTDGARCCAIGVLAKPGQNTYVSMKHLGAANAFSLQMEGHLSIDGGYETPALVFAPPAERWNDAVMAYKEILVAQGAVPAVEEKEIPRWWREPIFCGWGQMRYDYRQDHDNDENGNFVNVTDYCTQKRYEEYLRSLEQNDINPGTIIIDMGWAQDPAMAKPNPHKWEDMRGFIDTQHRLGRHVLLWYTPVVTQGLPDSACLMLEGRPVAPDPTSPVYQEILKEQIRLMLSDAPDALNADGFKIDFTQNTPSEEGVFKDYINSFWGLINENNAKHLYPHRADRQELIQVYDPSVWGVELLRRYIGNLYADMKVVKPDSMLITHTPNPYFADVVDVLRLNDLDGESDNVLDIMTARAQIAQIGCKHWLIDTDNDLMINKSRWRDYIALQPKLGIPDTYYATHIAASGEAFEAAEYDLLRQVFARYRQTLC